MEHTILIVEDDNDINCLLAENLTRAGYSVRQAFSGTEGRLLFEQQPPSLMLLDLMLPGMTGEELIGHVRRSSAVPVIVLSARDTGPDKVQLLRLGADDYVTKPFDEEELLARIEANLRRADALAAAAPANDGAPLAHRDILLDREARQVTVAGREVALTAREFAILELLLANPKKVFTKANIYTSVWADAFYGDDNTVNVHVSNLRAKLQGDYIQTVWGIGFKMQE